MGSIILQGKKGEAYFKNEIVWCIKFLQIENQ